MQILHLFPLIPILGFLTQEELIALKRKQKIVNRLRIAALILGLFILAITKPWQQPDHEPKKPDHEHVIRLEKQAYDDWILEVSEGKVVARLSNPGGGGGFDDEQFWRQRLEQLINYIVALREAGELYEADYLLELNGWILKEIAAICSRFGISLHEVLVRTLGPNYVVHIVFIKQDSKQAAVLIALYEPGTTIYKIAESFLDISGELIGIVVANGVNQSVVTLDEYVMAEKITRRPATPQLGHSLICNITHLET